MSRTMLASRMICGGVHALAVAVVRNGVKTVPLALGKGVPRRLNLRAGSGFRMMSSTLTSSVTRSPSASAVPDFSKDFDSSIPVERATLPPASWYRAQSVQDAEKHTTFRNNWISVGRVGQLQNPGDYFTGRFLGEPYIVCMDDSKNLRAFYNVCRHHGTKVAESEGCARQFVCPYHGWTYGLDGRLKKATRLKGIKDFRPKEMGLRPIAVDTFGPFIFIHFGKPVSDTAVKPDNNAETSGGAEGGAESREQPVPLAQYLNGLSGILDPTGYSSLPFLKRVSYKLGCNWKVYVDNYLDGGYHVAYAHKALGERLNLDGYATQLFDRFSVQSCPAQPADPTSATSVIAGSTVEDGHAHSHDAPSRPAIERVSGDAHYAWIYPNFMVNRYGPWMDTNLVWPLSPTECIVHFDYYLDRQLLHDEVFIKESLKASNQVQVEDTWLCEAVQEGLNSSAYYDGRYAPGVEYPMHHFHKLLHADLMSHKP